MCVNDCKYTVCEVEHVVHSPLHHKRVFLLHGQLWIDLNRIVGVFQFKQLKKKKFQHKYNAYFDSIKMMHTGWDMLTFCLHSSVTSLQLSMISVENEKRLINASKRGGYSVFNAIRSIISDEDSCSSVAGLTYCGRSGSAFHWLQICLTSCQSLWWSKGKKEGFFFNYYYKLLIYSTCY